MHFWHGCAVSAGNLLGPLINWYRVTQAYSAKSVVHYPLQAKGIGRKQIELKEKICVPMYHVYFYQRLGAAHSKRLSKQSFSAFFCNKARKSKKFSANFCKKHVF